jgi:hypothetical protein
VEFCCEVVREVGVEHASSHVADKHRICLRHHCEHRIGSDVLMNRTFASKPDFERVHDGRHRNGEGRHEERQDRPVAAYS